MSQDAIILFLFGLLHLFLIQPSTPSDLFILEANVFFIFFILYVISDFFKGHRVRILVKLTCFYIIAATLTFSASGYMILQRKGTQPHLFVHDGIIQTEAAIRFLIQGKNPYVENYVNTPLKEYAESTSHIRILPQDVGKSIPPSILYHYVYLPWYPVLSAIPFFIIEKWFGWYDQRLFHLLLWLASLFIVWGLSRKHENKLLFLNLFALNPIFLFFFSYGFNEIFVLFWILLTLFFLRRGNIALSSASFGLAVSSKHSAWLLIPFYFFHVFLIAKPYVSSMRERIFLVVKKTVLFFIVTVIIMLPFILWDFKAFWEDIYLYPSGSIPTSFPIFGFGFSVLLGFLGIISSAVDYFPFWMPQALFGFPLLWILMRKQAQGPYLSSMMFSYGLLLLVFWYFSRFFFISYAAYLSMIFIIAYCLKLEEKKNE